jgi:hypothetical protein
MDHVLGVSLDKSTTPWSVDIDQHGNANHVGRSPQPQTLVWELTGNAAGGDLQPLEWIEAPPEGIFGPPELAANGQRMTLTDLNDGPASSGTWIYRLSLTLDGQEYSTRETLPTGTTTNPSIKNH